MTTNHQSADLVRELRRLADAATPGPWHVRRTDDPSLMTAYYLTTEKGAGLLDVEKWDHPTTVVAIALLQDPNLALSSQSGENAEFIARSRVLVPRLCDALERAIGDRQALVDVLHSLIARLSFTDSLIATDQLVERARRVLAEREEG